MPLHKETLASRFTFQTNDLAKFGTIKLTPAKHSLPQLIRDYERKVDVEARELLGQRPQESFFGHMKGEIGGKIAACETDEEAFGVIDEWFDYYNKDRPIWGLRRMTPVEYFEHVKKTGEITVPKKYPKKRKKA